MTTKVNFKVIGCTGWEDDYSAKNVEIQNPFGRGWRSERYCMYPQQVVLRLDKSVRVRKLQFVSHEFMIASKVEFFIARDPSSVVENTSSLEVLDFFRLGYVAMSENDSNGHKSREMKSVNVDAVGRYVKLVLHTNYVNGFNLFNQVSILAINIIGLANWKTPPMFQRQDGIHTGKQPPVQISVIDDLSFSLSQDPESAELIKLLEAKKIQAVERDQFEEAKRLKRAVQEYLKVGEVLCVFEQNKRIAIEREDYDEAKKWKHEKRKLQQQTLQRLEIKSLLKNVATDQKDIKITDGVAKPHRTTKHDSPEEGQLPVITTTQSSSVLTSQQTGKRSPLQNLDNPQPLAGDKSPDHFSEHPDGSIPVLVPKPEQLTDAQVNQFTDAIQVLGMETIELLHSKLYQLREEGLKIVYDKLKEADHNKAEILRAMGQVLKKACNDKVTTCFGLSLSILQYLLGPYALQKRLTDGDISVLIDKVLPVLMGRLGDTNVRIQSSTESVLLELLANDQLQIILAQHLIKQPGHEKKSAKSTALVGLSSGSPVRSVSWRYAKARVELLQKSLEILNLTSAGLSVQEIMEFVNPCLQHINAKVRDAAAQLTVQLYKQYNGNVRDCLPVSSGDHLALKNPFWRALFEQLDGVDGKVKMCITEDNNEVAGRKGNKIRELRGQLDILRSLAHQGRQMTADEINEVLDPGLENNASSQQRIGEQDSVPVSDIDHTCPFCHVTRPELKQQVRMEQHYTVECPMLQQCKYCSQVVEIRHLPSHYLSKDCTDGPDMSQCPTCKEVYIQSQIDNHIRANRCSVPPTNCAKCPLCHANVENTDEAWDQHLMGVNAGCAKNPRRKRRNFRPKEKSSPKQTSTKEIVGTAVMLR